MKTRSRNIHAWKHTTDEGGKREVRAEKFGGKWRIQAQIRGEDSWTYYDAPLLDDLLELRRVLWNKYQRKHLAFEDVAAVDKIIRDAGGEVPEM